MQWLLPPTSKVYLELWFNKKLNAFRKMMIKLVSKNKFDRLTCLFVWLYSDWKLLWECKMAEQFLYDLAGRNWSTPKWCNDSVKITLDKVKLLTNQEESLSLENAQSCSRKKWILWWLGGIKIVQREFEQIKRNLWRGFKSYNAWN